MKRLSIVIGLILILTGCGGGSGGSSGIPSEPKPTPTPTPTTVAVTGVALNKTTLDLKEGESESLTATVSPSNATEKGVSWKSGDENIVTVDSNGKVAAVKAGVTTITVTTKDGSKTATVSVKVEKKEEASPQVDTTAEGYGEENQGWGA